MNRHRWQNFLWIGLFALVSICWNQAQAQNLQFYSSPSWSNSSSGTWGQNINVSYSIFNASTTGAGAFTVKFYVSNSSSINSSSYNFYTISYSGGLPALSYYQNQSYNIPLPGFIPSGLANGTNYIIGQISQSGATASSSINISSPPTNVQFYSNPSFGLTSSSTVQWGQTSPVGFQFSAVNYGAAANVVANLYLSTSTSSSGAYSLGSYSPVNIAMGTYDPYSGSFNLPISIPSGFPTSGTIYFVVTLTVNGSVQATNSTAMTVSTPAPDLVGYKGTPPGTSYNLGFGVQQSSASWGQVLGLEYAIANLTAGSAGPVIATVYLRENTSFGSGNTPASTGYYQFLTGSASPAVISSSGLSGGEIEWSVNGQGLPGYTNILQLPTSNPFNDANTQFYIGMVVNPAGVSGYPPITESNYANDCDQGSGIDWIPITITPPQPQISVSSSNPPSSTSLVSFGNVNISSTGSQTVTISDAGPGSMTISNISTSGTPFTIASIVSSVQNLAALSSINSATLNSTELSFMQSAPMAANSQESWVVTLNYLPTTAGNTTGSFTINSNASNTPNLTYTLNGFGVTVPSLLFTNPVPYNNSNLIANYGGIANGTSLSENFTLSNAGSAPLAIPAGGINLSNATQSGVWSLVSITSNTNSSVSLSSITSTGGNISVSIPGNSNNETWTAVVKFSPPIITPPATAGYAAQLNVASNDPNNLPSMDCTLQGQGLIPMTLSVASAINGTADTNPLVMPFGSVHATGQQKVKVTGTITLTNTGQIALPLSSISLASSTNFQITGIQSSTQGAINGATGGTIGPNSGETWTISVVFDPTVSGTDNTTLNITSSNPTIGTQPIALNGTGLNQPGLVITTPVTSTTPGMYSLPFGMVLNDGAGKHVGQQTFTMQNIGLQPVVVSKNGLTLTTSTGFSIISIQSSTQGAINLSTGTASIAANSAETWTVTVGLDPTANSKYTGTLGISSNDPVIGNATINLTGCGTVPSLTLNQSTSGTTLYLEAGQVYNITWTAADKADTASQAVLTLSTSLTTGTPSGLATIASMPYSATTTSYAWRPTYTAPTLGNPNPNNTFYIYGNLQDNSVSSGSFSAQKVQIEPAGSFNLLTPLTTTSGSYVYQYLYNGKAYGGTATLTSGSNVIYVTTQLPGGGTAVHEIIVNEVSSTLTAQGYTYDSLGRVSTYTNGNGITTTYTYSLGGNLIQTSATNGNVINYTYDSLNRKTSMIDSTGTTFYGYDDLDRVTSITYSVSGVLGAPDNLPLGYQYDSASHETQISYPGGEVVNYTYDNAGRLKTVHDVVNGTTTYNYTYNYNSTTGQLTSLNRGNGVTTNYTYDGAGRLTDIKHTTGLLNTTLAEYNYAPSPVTLDANGNCTTLLTTFNTGTQTQTLYTYDNQQRLIQVVYGAGATAVPNTDPTVVYTYDGNGDRLTQTTTVNGNVTDTQTYSYGSSNQLLQVVDQNGSVTSVTSYVYDQAGNRIQKITPAGTTYYAYDERNLLITVITPTDYITYTYNGVAQRVSKTLDGVTTNYIIDPTPSVFQTVQEWSNGSITQSYAYSADRLEVNPTNATSQFYLPDRLGTIRVITDPNGNVLQTMNYDAFGNQQ